MSAALREGSSTLLQPALLQRRCACAARGGCSDCRGRGNVLQRRGSGAVAGGVPASVWNTLQAPGTPLAAATRSFMQARIGHDFSRVRVHADDRAAASARAVGAQAYTVGANVVFAAGQYRPGTHDGDRLIAHELTHVAQQRSTPAPASRDALRVGDAGSASEREADRIAEAVHTGHASLPAASAQPSVLARQAANDEKDKPFTPRPNPYDAPSTEESEKPFVVPPNPYTEEAMRNQPPPPPPPAEQQIGDVTYGSLGKFGAGLLRHDAISSGGARPCSLIATMRIKFVQANPADWPSGRFERWKREASRVIAERWSLRHLLAAQGGCANNEPCRRSLVVVRMEPVDDREHHTVNVRYNTPGGLRSDALNWNEQDVRRGGDDLRRHQTTANHEFGHLLGLPHVAGGSEECKEARIDEPANPEPSICYGRGREERAGIMGAGDIVRVADYAPFLGPMRTATGCSWRVEGSDSEVSGSSGLLTGALLGGFLGAIGGAVAGGAMLGPIGALIGGLVGAVSGGLIGLGIGGLADEA